MASRLHAIESDFSQYLRAIVASLPIMLPSRAIVLRSRSCSLESDRGSALDRASLVR